MAQKMTNSTVSAHLEMYENAFDVLPDAGWSHLISFSRQEIRRIALPSRKHYRLQKTVLNRFMGRVVFRVHFFDDRTDAASHLARIDFDGVYHVRMLGKDISHTACGYGSIKSWWTSAWDGNWGRVWPNHRPSQDESPEFLREARPIDHPASVWRLHTNYLHGTRDGVSSGTDENMFWIMPRRHPAQIED